jgi:hypothetical protein
MSDGIDYLRVAESLCDLPDRELYDLLNDDTQQKLWEEFIASRYKPDDVQELFAAVEDYSSNVLDWSIKIASAWDEFLAAADLLNGEYREQIEDNYVARFSDAA